ncbi:ABC transporter substrate-binding protein [Nocardioides sp. InS609-2]|uniref:ABC transporter substrate-binding protein n=1 Tax=Nocardioides sp. InS609-2 TaxID=2760705 RepID=UPI0020C0A9D0|nr:ABC transporter substrate-binding protein [Nocardioides sp. InS609-2]
MLPRAACATIAALIVSFGAAGCAAEDTASAALAPVVMKPGSLTVCTDMPYEPFEYELDGKPAGFDVDLVAEVAKRLDVKSAIVDTDFDAIQSGEALNSGECDVAISAMTITGDRARVLDFSSPYFNASQALVLEAGSAVTSLADLGGKKVGVQGGTTGELYVTDNAPGTAEIVPFEDSAAMDAALEKGDVDAAVYDNTVVGDVVANNPAVTVAAEFDTGEQYGMAVKKNGNVDLLRTINDVLADLKSNGGYSKVYEEWFGSAPNTQN